MLQYDKIDISERTDIDKTDPSKECIICHCWYFKNNGYEFELYVCNGCHDILMIAYELKNVAILNLKGVGSSFILWGVVEMKLLMF